jgi:sporulation protein YlmC with PRC-barrel domain
MHEQAMKQPEAYENAATLIASDKVEGTAVYNHDGEKLGTVRNFMVDKTSGKAEYAVMSFGGFLGIGEDYHPIPWDKLNYNADKGGYLVDLDKDALMNAPRYTESNNPSYGPEYRDQVDRYYSAMPY